MPFEDDELVFNGESSTEAERFITWVRKRARSEGKQRDQEWIVDLVASCLGGAALRWYLKLDPTVQDSWNLLQGAILENWSDSGENNASSPLATIPTPAAAPLAAAALVSQETTTIDYQTGYLRFYGARTRTYLARNIDRELGDVLTCANRADALQVRFSPSEKPHAVEVLNGPGSWRWLGLYKKDPLNTRVEDPNGLRIVFVTPPQQHPTVSTAVKPGTAQCKVWSVSPASDQTVRMTWDNGNGDGMCDLPDPVLPEDEHYYFVVRSLAAFTRKPKSGTYHEARLVFEPV